MNSRFTRFGSPVLGQHVNNVYSEIYGMDGNKYVDILEASPHEIVVISRLIAYLHQKKTKGDA